MRQTPGKPANVAHSTPFLSLSAAPFKGLERLNGEVKRHAEAAGIFPNREAHPLG